MDTVAVNKTLTFRFRSTVGGIKTFCSIPFCLNRVLFKQERVPVPFNRKTGMEREAEQAANGATIVQPTTRTIASSNYMPKESKKGKRSTISVDLQVV